MAATVTYKYASSPTSGGSSTSGSSTVVTANTTFVILTFNGAGSNVNTPTPIFKIGNVNMPLELIATSTAGPTKRPTIRVYKYVSTLTPGNYNTTWGASVSSGTASQVAIYQVDGGTVIGVGTNTATSNSTNASLPAAPQSSSKVIYARGGTSVSGSFTSGGSWTTNVNQTAFNVATNSAVPTQTVTTSMSSSQSWATAYVELGEFVQRLETIGPAGGTTAVSNGGASTWSNPTNVAASDNEYATALASATVANNPYLDVTGFNLGVPSTSTVLSISAAIEARSAAPTAIDSIQLLKDGVPVGTAIVPTSEWSSTDKSFEYDLKLGSTSWTPAELNSPSFGLRFRFKSVAGIVTQTSDEPEVLSVGGSIPWTDLQNVANTNTSFATQYRPSSNASDNAFLRIMDLGFNIPSNASNFSVTGEIKRSREGGSVGNITTNTFRPVWNGQSGNSSISVSNWTTTPVLETQNTTNYTPEQVNSPTFGFEFRAQGEGGAASTSATLASYADSETNTYQWSNPESALTANSVGATFALPAGNALDINNFAALRLTGFSFNIPTDSTVVGVTVSVRCKRDTGSVGAVNFGVAQLMMYNLPIGSDMSWYASSFPSTWGNRIIGNTSDTWGTNLTPTEANSFLGLYLKVVGSTADTDMVAHIDSATMTIRYTTPNERNAQVQSFTARAQYTVQEESTVFVDSVTVAANIAPDGFRRFKFGVDQNQGLSSVLARKRQVKSDIQETIAHAFELFVKSGIVPKYFAFNVNEMEQVAIAMARGRGVKLQISEAETIVVAAMKRGRKLASTVTEDESLTTALSRKRAVAAVINETELMTAAIGRMRGAMIAIAEQEAVSVGVQRKRTIGFTVAEQEQLSIAAQFDRVKRMAFLVAETYTASVKKIKRLRGIKTEINSSENLAVALTRLRRVATLIAETEAMFADLMRRRGMSFNVNEVENVYALVLKNKGMSVAIAEMYSLQVGVSRARKLAALSSSTYSLETNLVRRRGMRLPVVEAESMTAQFQRTRGFVPLIVENEQAVATFMRARSTSLNIAEVEEVRVILQRLRKMSASIDQYEDVSIAFGKLKTLAMAFDETYSMQLTLSRTIRMAMLISAIEEVAAQVLRARGTAVTVDEKQEVQVLLDRVRGMTASIDEFENVAATLSRIRDVGFAWDETQSVGMFLGRLKVMSAAIIQSMNVQVEAVSRVRGLASIMPEHASYLAALERVRNMGTVISSEEGLQINFGRLRTMITEVAETQGVTAGSLRRLRGFITDIAETYGCDIKLTVRRIGNEKLVMTASFEQWVAKPDGTLNLQTKSMSWDIVVTPPIVRLDLPVSEMVVIDVAYEPMPTPAVEDLMSSGIKF